MCHGATIKNCKKFLNVTECHGNHCYTLSIFLHFMMQPTTEAVKGVLTATGYHQSTLLRWNDAKMTHPQIPADMNRSTKSLC